MSLEKLIAVGVVVITLVAGASAQASESLDGWVQRVSGPALAELIDNHPRLKGEPIEIVGMRDGSVVSSPDEATLDVMDVLTRYLVANSSVVLRLPGDALQTPAAHVLGVDIRRAGGSRAEVLVALVDRVEHIWIPGGRFDWTGHLPGAQPRLAQQPGSVHPPRLLSAVEIVRQGGRDGLCGDEPGCVDVRVVAHERLYLVPFFTVAGRMSPVNCEFDRSAVRGEQRYGLRLPEVTRNNRPALGFYALGFQDRAEAREVHDLLKQGSKRCTPYGNHAAWIEALPGYARPGQWSSLLLDDGGRAYSYRNTNVQWSSR